MTIEQTYIPKSEQLDMIMTEHAHTSTTHKFNDSVTYLSNYQLSAHKKSTIIGSPYPKNDKRETKRQLNL